MISSLVIIRDIILQWPCIVNELALQYFLLAVLLALCEPGAKMFRKSLLLLCSFTQAEFLVQGSLSLQVYDTVVRMAGYQVDYGEHVPSPYDVSLGYMFTFRNVAVMPVMIEGKATTLESYVNTSELKSEDLAPLEVLLKPGLRLSDIDVYMIMGYQVGNFKQNIEQDGHEFELKMKPNFYGIGYSKEISDYLDYLTELKVYYSSIHSYGIDLENRIVDPDLTISDARVRFGFRVRI